MNQPCLNSSCGGTWVRGERSHHGGAWGGILALADLGGHGLPKPQATTACLKNAQKMSLIFRVTVWR